MLKLCFATIVFFLGVTNFFGCGGNNCSPSYIEDWNEMQKIVLSQSDINDLNTKCKNFKKTHGTKSCRASVFGDDKNVSYEDIADRCDEAAKKATN